MTLHFRDIVDLLCCFAGALAGGARRRRAAGLRRRDPGSARPHCRVVLIFILVLVTHVHTTNTRCTYIYTRCTTAYQLYTGSTNIQLYAVPLLLKRQCDRTRDADPRHPAGRRPDRVDQHPGLGRRHRPDAAGVRRHAGGLAAAGGARRRRRAGGRLRRGPSVILPPAFSLVSRIPMCTTHGCDE